MKVVTLDNEVLEKAFQLCLEKLDEQRICAILNGQDDIEKQIAILQINDIDDFEHAKLLVNHLTGQDGPIREAVAIKLRELVIENKNLYLDNTVFYETFADAVCDVNPNICRFVVELLPFLQNQNELINIILNKIENIFCRIDNPDKMQKNFLTVRLFNLYWCLEAISELVNSDNIFLYSKRLLFIFKRAISFSDYTINEKIAKIIIKDKDNKLFTEIIDELKLFNNFYVQRYFKE